MSVRVDGDIGRPRKADLSSVRVDGDIGRSRRADHRGGAAIKVIKLTVHLIVTHPMINNPPATRYYHHHSEPGFPGAAPLRQGGPFHSGGCSIESCFPM